MTDPHVPTHPLDTEPLHPLDELASAHLDGVADPIDVAAASGLTGFADRVAGFEEVRRQIRAEAGPVDDARRESALAAALAAFDELAVVDDAAAGAAAPVAAEATTVVPLEVPAAAAAAPADVEATTVVPLEVAAARRGRPGRRWQLVGAAAAVAVGALALVPMLTGDSDGPTTTEFAADEQADADTLANDAARGAEEMSGGAGSVEMSTSMATPKIGDFKDYDELAGAVRKELPPAATADAAPAVPTTTAAPRVSSSLPPSGGGDPAVLAAPTQPGTPCPPPPDESTRETTTSVVYGGEATVDGQPYEVQVTEDGTGTRTMTVRDPASCTVTDERPL